MTLETFRWQTQGTPQGIFNHRVRSVQFGDGYTQVSGDGINPETQSWPLSFTGTEKEMQPILAFVRGHTIKSFIWTPPCGVAGLYRVKADSIRLTSVGGQVVTVEATFEQAHHP